MTVFLLLLGVFGVAFATTFKDIDTLVAETNFISSAYDCVIFVNDDDTAPTALSDITNAIKAYQSVRTIEN